MSGELEHRPELGILLDLLAEHEDRPLQRWVRTSGPQGIPVDLLTARDFPGFEAALDDLAERGFVVTRRS
ncbi:MAG: hypothetical protein QOF76_597 [Solirubrobacteraceae bacterium]|nr:hypothetical protein [Solirubrobacteraceae bacterium]